jgi:hypothetical protein
LLKNKNGPWVSCALAGGAHAPASTKATPAGWRRHARNLPHRPRGGSTTRSEVGRAALW